MKQVVEGARALDIPLSPSQLGQLQAFHDLLADLGTRAGVIGPSEAPRLFERHILDSMTAAPVVGAVGSCVDVGSGGGLPGIVLATVLPAVDFTLVDSRQRRAGFMELAVERLGLRNVTVLHKRAENLAVQVDVVTARAFGDLTATWKLARPLLVEGGRLVYYAGERGDHLAAAREASAEQGSADVAIRQVLANRPPLVIMTRSGRP